MKIGFIGLGKLGLPVALTIESKGHEVRGYDVNSEIADILTRGTLPYIEEGADELLIKTKIKICDTSEMCEWADIVFIAVQTPHKPLYEGITPLPDTRADFDYSYLIKAVESVKKAKMVVVISTVLPGTIRREILPIRNVVYNPFFIAMGTTIQDFLNPEFVLIGTELPPQQLLDFYYTIHNKTCFNCTIEEAEIIKVSYNTYITAKICIANTIMEICHKTGNANCDNITKALTMATDRIISSKYMLGGMGDGGACLVGGQLIQTKNGLVPIEKIKIGDEVLTHKGRWRRVTNTFKNEYDGDIVSLSIGGKNKINVLVTPNHEILSATRFFQGKERYMKSINNGYDNHKRKAMRLKPPEGHSDFSFKSANSLEVGDYVNYVYKTEKQLPIPSIQVNKHYSPLKVIETPLEMMRVFGWWVAEGSVYGRSVYFSLHAKEKPQAEWILNVLKKHYDLGGNFRVRKNGLRFRVSSVKLVNYLNLTFGKLAKNKSVPYSWLDLPKEYLKEFLRGLFEGDGGISKGNFSYFTVSKELINFVDLALIKLEIPHSLRVRPAKIDKNNVNHLEAYHIQTSSQKINELLHKSIGETEKKNTIYFEDGFMVSIVKTKKIIKFIGYVYNLEVEEDHSFCGKSVCFKNCHPRDAIAMSWLAKKLNLSYDIYEKLLKCREEQTKWLAKLCGNNVIVLGKSFKKNTNITAGSAAILLTHFLENWELYDPYIGDNFQMENEGMVYFIATEHDIFRTYKFPKGSVVIDPFRFIQEDKDITLIQIGKNTKIENGNIR